MQGRQNRQEKRPGRQASAFAGRDFLSAIALTIADRTLRLDGVCISIAAILFYIYYNELAQQVDALTSLLHRHSCNCCIEALKKPAVILFFDVDRFKDVNDHCGQMYDHKQKNHAKETSIQ